MGPGRCTAIGVVAKLMDMKSTLGIGIISCKMPGNSGRRFLIDLLKVYYPGDFRVTPNKSNCARLAGDPEFSLAHLVLMWVPGMPKKTRLNICNNRAKLKTSREKKSYLLVPSLVPRCFKNEMFLVVGGARTEGSGYVSSNLKGGEKGSP